jgi:magnesium-transporting ATPase (P-type)
MNMIRFLLKGFGYKDAADLGSTTFKMDGILWVASAWLGTFRYFLKDSTGLDLAVFLAFVVLIIFEFQTGLKVSMKIKGERFKSRKFGRMILKIGTFVAIVMVLHAFSIKMVVPSVLGFELNPFLWLYYMVFMAIVFQLFISWMENLGCLGYKETRTIAGFVLRKFNKWFEFDGSKDNGTE